MQWRAVAFLVARSQALYYFLLANPSPAAGFLDFFVLNPVFQQLERQVCCWTPYP